MGQLFDLIEAHRDRHRPYAPSYSKVAAEVGVSRQTLLNWRTPTQLPGREHLARLAEVTGTPYLRVLDAALADTGYLSPTPQDVVNPDPGVTTDEVPASEHPQGEESG